MKNQKSIKSTEERFKEKYVYCKKQNIIKRMQKKKKPSPKRK